MKSRLRQVLCTATMALPAVAACGREPGHKVGFNIGFANGALQGRAVLVEASLRRGGCDGEVVFSTEVTREREGDTPDALAQGRYGFSARARDASCLWFAQGCSEATLPSNTSLTVVLSEMKTPERDDSCERSSDGGAAPGTGDASLDAALGLRDAGAVDPGFDPAAPKCGELPPELVACYDFDGTLTDATANGNDASGSNVQFEPAVSGSALRVNAETIAVPDDASLDFTGSFTIEVWMRADGLVNLDGEANAVSLLVDKDQQYDVGFDPNGDLTMEVYTAVGSASDLTATAADVVVGTFTYVAFVYDGFRARIYQDGSEVGSADLDLTPFAGNGGTMHVGSGSPNTTRPFNGLIDAMRLWNVARSDREVCEASGRTYRGQRCR